MAPRVTSFVILAGMRTGSNLLEEHLATVEGLTLHGELFNPHFFGQPKTESRFGLTDRARDPLAVLDAMRRAGGGLPGFRLFVDHDPRVLAHVLADPATAKIVLTRRAIDSFVSLQIARTTGQWWLGDARSARSAKITFDAGAYAEFRAKTAAFHARIDRALQTTGQTAFRLTYDDCGDPDVIAGLVRFLGLDAAPNPARIRARVQNPTPVEDRLTNPEAARAALAAEATDIGDPPVFEPDRGPGLKFFHAGLGVPLLYMPIRGAGEDPVPDWLAALGGGAPLTGLTQRDLRRWKRERPGHLSFTVLRHPLARAHDAFCRHILPGDQDGYAEIRHALRHRFAVPLSETWPVPAWSLDDHRAAFLGFLVFLKANLGGQTSLRVDNTWATQERLLSAIAMLNVPDRVFRETGLSESLGHLAREAGAAAAPKVRHFTAPHAFPLTEVVTPDIEKAAEAAFRRDYMMFGFGPWLADPDLPPGPQAA